MSSHQYWRSPSSDAALALCAVLAVVGLAVVGGYGWVSTADRLLGRGGEPMTFALALAVVSAVAGAIGLLLGLGNRAAGVALVIDRAGITDNRGSGVLIPWSAIRSLDAEVRTVTDARTWISWVQEAKVILYVDDEGGRIETVEVYADGLNRKPAEVVRQVKVCWLEAATARQAGTDDSPDPNRIWVG